MEKTNQYSFDQSDRNQFIFFVYEDVMQQYNLSDVALRKFFNAVRFRELDFIRNMFKELTIQQKAGLLTISFDFNHLQLLYMANPYRGTAIEIAKKKNSEALVAFLTAEKETIKNIFQKALFSLFNEKLPFDMAKIISEQLKRTDISNIICTGKKVKEAVQNKFKMC